MSLESQPKPVDIPEVTNKPSSVKYNASEAGSGPSPVVDRSTTPVLQEFMDPNMCYFPNGYASPYYFGGYGGHTNEWEDYPRYDGIEGVYGENGTMMYHPGYGYPPYGAYPPGGPAVSNMGPDGQLYGPQQYQYAAPYYQQHNPSSVGQCNSNNQTPVSKEEVSTSIPPDQGTVPVETPNGIPNGVTNGHAKTNGAPFAKPSNQPALALNSNGSHDRGIFPSYQESQFTFDGTRTSGWLDGPVLDRQRKTTSGPLPSSGPRPFTAKSQNTQPLGHVMGLHPSRPNSGIASPPAFMNRIYSNSRMYNHSAGTLGLPEAYGSNSYDSRLNGRGWLPIDNKYKPRGRGNGYLHFSNENMDALNEQNKGPRASRFKNQRSFPTGVTLAVKGQNITLNATEDSSNTPARDQYNRTEFVTNYSEAKFFVIKSYSEDDVHKSIKYNVWASTPNGNKKLDAAYQEAKAKSNGSPIFLLFSVNTSGQFCGLAEMMGPVDFNKTLDYWQQDKWNGCFPVKWHIIKDVPNNLLKHIILENNDNKPVTNSRDTQEVNFEQGLEILKIFKDYVSKTCLLDDFEFYESRQKLMQESRSKLRQLKQIQKPIWDGKMNDTIANDKEVMKPKPNKLTEPITILQKDSTHCLLDRKPLEENALVVEAAEAANGTKPICEKKVPNGVANGC